MNAKEKIYNGLVQFGHYTKVAGVFSVAKFMGIMEPIFVECGCRQDDVPLEDVQVLIITQGGVGDFVLFSPCLREIRQIYDKAHITLVVSPACQNLVELCPYVDTIISADFRLQTEDAIKLYDQCLEVMNKKFKNTFDIAFNFDDTLPGVLLGYMSGARERILHVDERLWNLWHSERIPYALASRLSTVRPMSKAAEGHYVDRHLVTIGNFTQKTITNRELEVWFVQQDIDYVRNRLKVPANMKIIALCMGGAGGGIKSYPADRYVALLKRIVSDDEMTGIIIIGGSGEIAASEFVMRELSAYEGVYIQNFTNQLTYRQTAALLSLCKFYIGNDTGAMHIAAAVGVPILAVYSYPADMPLTGNSTVEIYYPYQVPAVIIQPDKALPECRKSRHQFRYLYGCSAMKAHCIAQISVEEVYKSWQNLQILCKNT